jgi:hypothetical protein
MTSSGLPPAVARVDARITHSARGGKTTPLAF